MILEKDRIKPYISAKPPFGTKPFVLISILFFLYLFTIVLHSEIFTGQAWNEIEHWFSFNLIGSYLYVFLLNLVLGSFIIFLGSYYFSIKLNKKVLIMCLILLLGETLAAFTFPKHFTYTDETYKLDYGSNAIFTYNLDMISRVMYYFTSINSFIFLYVCFSIMPNIFIYHKQFYWIYFSIIFICFAAFFYSLIKEFDQYKIIFNYGTWGGLASFMGTKNNYGFLLFLGLISSILLSYYKKNYYFLLITLFLFINMFLTHSRTCIITSSIIILLYLIYLFVQIFKVNKKKASIIFAIFFVVIALFLLSFSIPNNRLNNLFNQVLDRLVFYLTDKDGGTLQSRYTIQYRLINLLYQNPSFLIFGLGNHQFGFAFYFAADSGKVNVWQPHNAFFNALGEGGLIRFVIYILFTLYLFYFLIVKLFKEKNKDAFIYLCILFAFEVRGLVEPEYFFSTSLTSIFCTLIILIPLLAIGKKEDKSNSYGLRKRIISKGTLLFIIAPIFMTCSLLTSSISISVSLFMLSLIIYIIGGVCNYQSKHRYAWLNFIITNSVINISLALLVKKIYGESLIIYLQGILFTLIESYSLYYLFLHYIKVDECFYNWTRLEKKVKRYIQN